METLPDGYVLTVKVPHEQMDAYGGLLLLSSSEKLRNAMETDHDKSKVLNFKNVPANVLSTWHTGRTVKYDSCGITFTQKLILAMLEAELRASSIDICVATDDLHAIDAATAGGNSLGLIKVNTRRLNALSRAPKNDWRVFLSKRFEHAIEFSSSNIQAEPSPILISSLGNLAKYAWFAPEFHPSVCTVLSTPADGALNVLTWSVGEVQAIQLIGATVDEEFKGTADRIGQAWKGLFYE